MIALDTNVLIRYIVEDDEAQTRVVTAFMDDAIVRGEPFFVAQIVVCEVVWVLTTAYRFAKHEVTGVLREISRTREIVMEGADEVRRATDAFEKGKGDFADYLIRERSDEAECSGVATFDKAVAGERGFIALR